MRGGSSGGGRDRLSRLADLGAPVFGAALGAALLPESLVGVLAGGGAAALLRGWFSSARAAPSIPPVGAEMPVGSSEADVIAALPVPVLTIETDGTVIFANAEAESLLERRLVGQHISLVFRSPALLAAVDEALEGAPQASLDFGVRRPREMMLAATLRSLRSERGGARVLVVLQNVTDRLRAAEVRSAFVANASHELRTPLAAISGIVETLQGPARSDPVARDRFLDLASKQTARMARLIDDLLSLSRIEADENILPTDRQDIVSIVGEAVAAVRPIAEEQGTSIRATLPEGPVPVRGSRDELVQVFVNLLENAVKYSGHAGPVDIDATLAGSSVAVTVSDSGPGISAEHIPRLTERFFRVDSADSRARGGTGLGLAIVKHIVNRHRGTLGVKSQPGKGSDFTVSLPLIVGPGEGAS